MEEECEKKRGKENNLSEEDRKKFENRMEQINHYIHENYNQQISLKELAVKLNLSNGYLARFFKQNYGMSFAEYLIKIRLSHVVNEILYTDAPISQIAYDNGFITMSVFQKTFKKVYGMPASEMRKNKQNYGGENVEKVKKSEKKKRGESSLAIKCSKTPEIEVVETCEAEHSVIKSETIKNFWGNTMNVGVASELLRSEVQEHVKVLKQMFGFRYIRFWNIFSPEFLINIEDISGNYNFGRLDIVFDFLVNLGLKPHIDLGMKPHRILYNLQNMQTYDTREKSDLDVLFQNLGTIEQFLKSLMQHLIYRYGNEEVGSWRIEAWFNESLWNPDYFEQYYTCFGKIYRTIKKYSKEISVGGCGLRLDSETDLMRQFLEQWNESDCRPDFLSAYLYHYEKEEKDYYAKRTTDNEFVLHRIMRVKEQMQKAGVGDIPLFISEWNFTASVRNYLNDSCYNGAYIIKNILDIYGKTDEIVHYMATDRSQQYYDSNELLFGGSGILSKDGIIKPAGFAFDFLKRLYPYYIGRGKNYLLSTDRHDSYGIVCHNQKKLGKDYYLSKEDELEKKSLWKYFESHEKLKLKLKLNDVSVGTYQIKRYRVNEKYGSVMSIWRELNYEKRLSRDDIKYFQKVCEPKLTIDTLKTEKNEMNLEIDLMENEITFIRIQKIL